MNYDYTQLTDEQFEQHREALMTELSRRNELREAPERIKDIAVKYQEMGGDKNVLVDALANAEKPEPELTDEEVL